MPLFVCDVCHAIENTGAGFYWPRNMKNMWADASLHGKALCSECTPSEFRDGSHNPRGGKWHGRFEKEIATIEAIVLEGPNRFVYFGLFEEHFATKSSST